MKTAYKKLFAVAIAYGKTSWLAGVWAHDDGAEWMTRWTDGAYWRRMHRCKLFCCSTRLFQHPLWPPAPRDRRARVHSLIQRRRGAALSRRGWAHIDGCRRGICTADTLMLASCRVFGRHARYSSLGQALKVRKAREMQLTAVLGPLLLAILGVFADARSARMAAAEATRSSDGRLGDRVSRL